VSNFDRRRFLKDLIGKLALATGSVVLASTRLPLAEALASMPKGSETHPPGEIVERADQLAAEVSLAEEAAAGANEFLNGGFRNTPLGGFRNSPLGGFRNTPLGGFRNSPLGGFRNTPLGSFANGGWPNGGWGGFGNGGWPNGGWHNWW
jgi:hypothetical protein